MCPSSKLPKIKKKKYFAVSLIYNRGLNVYAYNLKTSGILFYCILAGLCFILFQLNLVVEVDLNLSVIITIGIYILESK
jgi:hypothetical protein